MRRTTTFIICFGLAFAAGPGAANVSDHAGLAGAVGLVVCSKEIGNRTWTARGTGTVVGSTNTVLTVAHIFVAYRGRSRQRVEFDFPDCVFRQYDASGAVSFETTFTQATYGEFRQNAGLPNQDWAVLRTSEPLPATAETLGFGAVADLTRQSRVPIAMLAFHSDWRDGPRGRRDWRRAPALPELTEGTLFEVSYSGFLRLAHTAETGRMSSGAAIVRAIDDGRSVVVGVHRSAARYGDFKLAVPVSGELEAALERYADGRSAD